jgi:hypothetical protein
MVIGEGTQDYVISSPDGMPDGPDPIQGLVLELLRSILSGPGDTFRFRLYRGRGYGEAPDGQFSFVPRLPCEDPGDCAFARPVIRLPRPWLNPSQWRGARCTPATPDELRQLWDEIVRQVANVAGLALGVHLDAPEQVTGETESGPAVTTASAVQRAARADRSGRPDAARRC